MISETGVHHEEIPQGTEKTLSQDSFEALRASLEIDRALFMEEQEADMRQLKRLEKNLPQLEATLQELEDGRFKPEGLVFVGGTLHFSNYTDLDTYIALQRAAIQEAHKEIAFLQSITQKRKQLLDEYYATPS